MFSTSADARRALCFLNLDNKTHNCYLSFIYMCDILLRPLNHTYLDGAENTQCGQLQTHFSLRALHPSERHGHQILHKYPGAKHMWMRSSHNALHEAHHVFIQHALHVPRIAPRRKIKNHVFNLMVFWPHWPPN